MNQNLVIKDVRKSNQTMNITLMQVHDHGGQDAEHIAGSEVLRSIAWST